jgi:hypothetical protein
MATVTALLDLRIKPESVAEAKETVESAGQLNRLNDVEPPSVTALGLRRTAGSERNWRCSSSARSGRAMSMACRNCSPLTSS